MNNMPKKVKCIRKVEVWDKDCTLLLIDGMYKSLPGCIFGLSVNRIKAALLSGEMIEIPLSYPNKF